MMVWEQVPARSGAWQVRRLADASLDPALVENLSTRAKTLLNEGKLHSESDVTIAVGDLVPNTTEIVDAFVIAASEAARHHTDRSGPFGIRSDT